MYLAGKATFDSGTSIQSCKCKIQNSYVASEFALDALLEKRLLYSMTGALSPGVTAEKWLQQRQVRPGTAYSPRYSSRNKTNTIVRMTVADLGGGARGAPAPPPRPRGRYFVLLCDRILS